MNFSRDLLDPEACTRAMANLDGWQMHGIELVKGFEFPDYAHAVMFTVAVAHLAETLDHHPDILLKWGRVEVKTHTHTAGGITPLDIELARRIENLSG